MTMRNSGMPEMMAGSSDSGSALLMMVTSAGGSLRIQPERNDELGMNQKAKNRVAQTGAASGNLNAEQQTEC